jgi:hypothetical protein
MAQAPSIQVKRSDRIISPKGRCSYPHLFKPSAFQGEGEPKFSVALLIDKKASGTKEFIAKIKAAQESALKELYNGKLPQNLERWGISDGDESEDATAKGNYVIKASSKNRPAIIDGQGTEILTETDVYGGCYGRINFCAKAYGTTAKGGVTLELNVFQKIGDGEAFGGAEKAKQQALAEMGAYEEEEAF